MAQRYSSSEKSSNLDTEAQRVFEIPQDLTGSNKGATKNEEQINVTYYDDDLLSSSSECHVFTNPQQAKYYRDLYESTDYECRHLFDPDMTWTEEEERSVVKKNDWYVTFWAFIMFTALDFDRYNIAQALSANMLDDLKLTTDDYNLGNTINLVCFLAAELPSQLISKKIGADIWIPTQLCLWSAVSMCQAAMTTRAGFLATRGLLGALQGGFICDVCLWMSYFFTSKELPFRLSLFYIANPMTSVWSSLLSFALLKIKTSGIMEQSFRWLFLIEGIFTFLVGVASFFKMPASAAQTKAWYRKNGWYTDREEKIVVNRVLRDDPQKGDMNNRQPVSLKELWRSLTDYDLLPIYIVRLLADIGNTPVKNYMTLTLRKLGFSTYQTNALTIPYNVLCTITMVIMGYLTEKINERSFLILVSAVWLIATLIPLRFWPGSQVDIWGTYALLTVILSSPPVWALSISWCSANSNSVRSRAVSAALVNMFSQTANIIGSNIYRADDKPLYHRGNTQLVGIAFGFAGSCLLTKAYYIYRNKYRDAIWSKMTTEEQEEYKLTTTDVGNKRLDFRFVH
ncbi:hypothetical protein HG537_0B00160 [Torulaspora globosa]|uniref:Major facilitator superfamily (MFS) profile domain-containing protein n=1 Tax=Torulaspora globosa TaxID=48254 RepID=A0A7H9HN34_9SACH|nr:hypothetical protein HG537_0B00160 [Torulaspora sp. CBS 2947]